MFTLYRIVKRSGAETVPDKASVHTRNATFGTIYALEQDYFVHIFRRCNICNATESLFLFTLYRISFCDAPFHHLVQCKHSLSQLYPAHVRFGTALIEQCSAPCLQMKICNSTWIQVQRSD